MYCEILIFGSLHISRDRRRSTTACPACRAGSLFPTGIGNRYSKPDQLNINQHSRAAVNSPYSAELSQWALYINYYSGPRQDKTLLYQHDWPNEPTKEGPLSYVLFESPFASISTVSRATPRWSLQVL